MFKLKHLVNFPCGMFFGSILMLALAAILDADISDELKKLYTFIFSAMTTLFAATFALAGSLNSASTQRELDEDNRIRRLSAAKANLPKALDKATDCATIAMHQSAKVYLGNDREEDFSIEKLQPDQETLDTLLNVIENADPKDSKFLSLVLSNFQVYSSRLKPISLEHGHIRSLEFVINWAMQFLIICHCFKYARGSKNIEIDFTKDDLMSKTNEILRVNGLDDTPEHERQGVEFLTNYLFQEFEQNCQ